MTPPFDQKAIVTEEQKRRGIIFCVNTLTSLAMENRDKLHVVISYKPHVDWVSCEVSHLCRDYLSNEHNAYLLLNKYVRLSEIDALEQMKALHEEVKALIEQRA